MLLSPPLWVVAHGAIYCAYGYFFEKFDEKGLAFLHQDKTVDGKESRFFKLVSRETAGDKGKGRDKK